MIRDVDKNDKIDIILLTDLSDPVTTKNSNNFYNRPGLFTSPSGQPTSAEGQQQQPQQALSKCLRTQSTAEVAASAKSVNSAASKQYGYVSIDSACDNKSIGAKIKTTANNNNKDMFYVSGEGKSMIDYHFNGSHKCSDFEEDDDEEDDEDLENQSCSASYSAPDEFDEDEFRSNHVNDHQDSDDDMEIKVEDD